MVNADVGTVMTVSPARGAETTWTSQVDGSCHFPIEQDASTIPSHDATAANTSRNTMPASASHVQSLSSGESAMKIVVIGGSGLIGSRVVKLLGEAGHEALAASPRNGGNAVTGEGLSNALGGAGVGVGVTNAPSWETQAELHFFRTSPRKPGKGQEA